MRMQTPLAAAILVIAAGGCSEEPKSVTKCTEGLHFERPLLVLESDLSAASALARIDTRGCVTERPSFVLGGDPSLAHSRGRTFVAIRDSSRIGEIDPAGPSIVEGTFFEIPPRDRVANPHDVAVAPDGTLWIPRYNMSSLAVLHPNGDLAGEIDLSAYADDDGSPEMEAAIAIGDKVYVSLERLGWSGTRYLANDDSLVVELDVGSRSITRTITLQGRAPFGRLIADPEDGAAFFAAVPGEFDAIDERDGIERVDTASGRSRLAITETELGGSVSDIAIASATEAYAIVARPEMSNDTSLVLWNPTSGKKEATLATTPGEYRLWGLALLGDGIAVGDRDRRAPRIRIFSRETGTERGSIPLDVLPPVTILPL